MSFAHGYQFKICGVDNIHKFHWSERYTKGKQYNTEIYWADYGHGRLRYRNGIGVVLHAGKEIDYVIAKEILTNEEQKKLAKFCPCDYCKGKIPCLGCAKCITYENDSIDQAHINEARKQYLRSIDKKKESDEEQAMID